MQFDGGARQGGDPSKHLVHHLGNAHDHLGNKCLYNWQGCGKKESHDEVEQKGGTGNGHKIGEEKIGGKRPEGVGHKGRRANLGGNGKAGEGPQAAGKTAPPYGLARRLGSHKEGRDEDGQEKMDGQH